MILSPTTRARLLRDARAYRLTTDGCDALLDALGEASTADYETTKRAADRRRQREKRTVAGVTKRNTPPSSVSNQSHTKTAPDAACDYAEGLTTSANGGRDS